ncbi:helicase-related protein [Hymenobacter perfusus]|uniref:Helicase n=1 Tax=Hymenobacter perfusus TaxID=1236770 RepID=A0A3R9M7D2_9BACT|nr:helicase-related protein [Hymenobacter perfusus]RSK38988.1 helicase [Hymenobacter perfusus]
MLVENTANRTKLLRSLRLELVGPEQPSETETLIRERPGGRYGVGILYPIGASAFEGTNPTQNEPEDEKEEEADEEEVTFRRVGGEESSTPDDDAPDDDGEFDLTLANARRPSSMALSFVADIMPGMALAVHVAGGRYNRVRPLPGSSIASVDGSATTAQEPADRKQACEENENQKDLSAPGTTWHRHGVEITLDHIAAEELCGPHATYRKTIKFTSDQLQLEVQIISRRQEKDNIRLLTVALTNRTLAGERRGQDSKALFQAEMLVRILIGEEPVARILPYPSVAGVSEGHLDRAAREEEASMALLYRNQHIFAIGHGCAADWTAEPLSGAALTVKTDMLPQCEVAALTPDIRMPNESGEWAVLSIPMAPLAGLTPGEDGLSDVRNLLELYGKWIADRHAEVKGLAAHFRPAANSNLKEAEKCLQRMREGLEWLGQDKEAAEAFRLANHAILLQQRRGGSLREPRWNEAEAKLTFAPFTDPDLTETGGTRGNWRPFQLAFILMNLRSAVVGDDLQRENVELIWFPTGGGKTEAYLGLSAFAVFYRYLTAPDSELQGTHILMRYTLRLLTAQQFQRAARLICAMEWLRARSPDQRLNGAPVVSIGLWLGGETTPNWRAGALKALQELTGRNAGTAKNPLLISRCPWCNARMGVRASAITGFPARAARAGRGRGMAAAPADFVLGYQQEAVGDGIQRTVVFACPDAGCHFSSASSRTLPVYVVDEDIYELRPTLVIGTVDKFAQLAARPEARSLFGIDADGHRIVSPPGLIIQDELHLIAGPLGSIVGLYEGVIEELCTDRRTGSAVRPKIISSTATVRRYREQIKNLYAREQVTLFPPPGLVHTDSFFSAPSLNVNGQAMPGRIHVGVHAPGLGSLQTAQVRTFSSLLHSPTRFGSDQAKDPWWSLLLFYNSLRELGGASTLFQSDIREYLRVQSRREPEQSGGKRLRRRLWQVLELTGRVTSEEVVGFIEDMERPCGNRPVDVCLASNIIEVGVDIDRLALMAIVGQPKTTAQYIQVSGRVGRRTWERPGVVVTLYSPSKPRDRSHFEQFRSYHERLYAQVEPTSLTPFSPPALDRALHALMICWVRQRLPVSITPDQMIPIRKALDELRDRIILPRVRTIAPGAESEVSAMLALRRSEWEDWQPQTWQDTIEAQTLSPGLTYPAGEAEPVSGNRQWALPGSMRNVDATCSLKAGILNSNSLHI